MLRSLEWNVVALAVFALLLVSESELSAQVSSSVERAPTVELLPTPARSAPTPEAVGPLTIRQISELVRAEVDETILIQMVRDRGVNRAMAVDDLLSLRKDNASNELLRAIQQASPRSIVSIPTSPIPTQTIRVYERPAPPPVIIRTAPRYYYRSYLHPYAHPHLQYRYRAHHPHHHHGGSRVTFGFSF